MLNFALFEFGCKERKEKLSSFFKDLYRFYITQNRSGFKCVNTLFQVFIGIPVICFVISIYLIIAPFLDNPSLAYLIAAIFILAGLLFYFPLVYFKKVPPFMGTCMCKNHVVRLEKDKKTKVSNQSLIAVRKCFPPPDLSLLCPNS